MDKSSFLKVIGKNVRRIRESKGMAQVDLAVKVEGKIDTTNISRIEKGRTNPTIYTLYRICQALDVPLSDLVELNSINQGNDTI